MTQEQGTAVTINDLDMAVKDMQQKKEVYEEAKAASNDAHASLEAAKENLLSLLTSAGKSSYKVDGIGTVSVVDKLKVSMPTSPEQKEAFFQWLRDNEGADGFNHYATVNYNSLNSLYNMKFDQAVDKSEFNIPGIDSPEHTTELRFRKN